MPESLRGIVYATIAALLWGVLAIVLKVSLVSLTPADITWFRFLLAFVVLAGYYYFRKPHYLRILKKPPLLLVIATVCLAINYYGFIEGVHKTSPSVAQVFIQLGPVMLALGGYVLFKEKISWQQIFGLVLVLAGLFIFYKGQVTTVSYDKDSLKTGVIWVIIAAVAWAVYSILLKFLVLKHPPMQLNLVIFGLPVLLYQPFVNFSHFANIGLAGWLILLFLGLNTLFAYALLTMAIHYTEANKVSVILILNPILTFVIMAIIGHTNAKWIEHEQYTIITLTGALIIITGAVLTILKKNKQGNTSLK